MFVVLERGSLQTDRTALRNNLLMNPNSNIYSILRHVHFLTPLNCVDESETVIKSLLEF